MNLLKVVIHKAGVKKYGKEGMSKSQVLGKGASAEEIEVSKTSTIKRMKAVMHLIRNNICRRSYLSHDAEEAEKLKSYNDEDDSCHKFI